MKKFTPKLETVAGRFFELTGISGRSWSVPLVSEARPGFFEAVQQDFQQVEPKERTTP